MAQKRTLVNRLNVDATNLGGISTKTFASPVDTYVRPVEIQSTPSPLSQFVTALAPAVEAKANKELEVKLKRERQIENFNYKKRMQHVENQAFITRANQISDYNNNPELYHQTDQAVIIEKYKKHTFDNVEQMKKEGADELQIQNYALKMETHNIELIAKINEGKKTFIKNEENKSIVNTAIAFIDTNKEITDDNIKLFKEIWDGNAEAHATLDAKTKKIKPDHKRMNKLAIKLAQSLSISDPNNIVLAYLEKEKILNTKDNIAIRSTLRAARDGHVNKVNTAQIKATAIDNKITEAVLKGNILDMSFKDGKGGIKTYTAYEAQEAAKKNQAYRNLPTALKFKKMATMGIVFPEVQNQVLNGVKFLTTDQGEPTDATNAAIKESYVIYQNLKNAGNNMSFLNKADKYAAIKFKALQFHVDERGASGQDIQTVSTTLDGDGIGDPEVGIETIVKKDFNNAASLVRNMDFKVPRPLNILKTVEAKLTKGWNSPLANVTNSPKIRGEIATNAHYFLMGGGDMTEEKAIKLAIELAEEDNPVVTSALGNKYSFEQMNTDMDAKISPTEVIPKYNELLAKSKIIRQAMKDKHSLVAGEYDVALYPDENDPTKAIIKTFSLDGSYLGQLGGAWDKRTLLSNQDQLNQLMATVKTQDNDKITTSYNVLTTDTYNQLINTSLDAVLFDEFSNTQKMLNPNSDGSAAIRRSKDKADINAPAGIVRQTINNVLESIDPSLKEKFQTVPMEKLIEQNQDVKKLYNSILNGASNLVDTIKNYELNLATSANASTIDGTEKPFVPSNQPTTGENVTMEGNTTAEKTASLISTQEGFKASPYADGKAQSVGYGFYLPSLEPDEKALIKNINNVTIEEGKAVLGLKIQKIGNYLNDNIPNFSNLPEKAQIAVTSMGYQLGVTNIPRVWKKFTAAITEAGKHAQGSFEQANALLEANFEMLYNVSKDGTISLNKWATQTKERAFEMANAVIEDINIPSFISSAEASTIRADEILMPKPRPSNLKGTIVNVLDKDEKSSNIISAPYKALLSNIVGIEPNFDTKDIGGDTLAIINQATATAEARGSSSVEYGDYPLTKRGLKVGSIIANFKDISGNKLSSQQRKQMEAEVNAVYPNNPIGLAMLAYDLATDPVLKAAGFVGGFSIQKDKEGNKFIKERWNFNNKSKTEGTIYKKMRGFFSTFAPITEDEGSEVFVKLATK